MFLAIFMDTYNTLMPQLDQIITALGTKKVMLELILIYRNFNELIFALEHPDEQNLPKLTCLGSQNSTPSEGAIQCGKNVQSLEPIQIS